MSVNFCHESVEAAKAGTETSPNAKVFKVNKGEVVKFVVAANKDLAISRFASEVLEVNAVRDGKKPRGEGGSSGPRVSKKHIDEMISKAADAATPEEAQKLLKEAKSLSQQLEERRAAKKAAKANGAPPAPPTP